MDTQPPPSTPCRPSGANMLQLRGPLVNDQRAFLLATGWSCAERMGLSSRQLSWTSVRVRRTSSEGCTGVVSCAPCRTASHQTAYSTTQQCRALSKMMMVSESCYITSTRSY